MRRALIFLLGFLLPLTAAAQGLNFNDQKSVDAELNRRVEEQLKKFKPEMDLRKKLNDEMQAKAEFLRQQQGVSSAPPSNVPPPEITCTRGGCNGELCIPTLFGVAGSVGSTSTCDYMTFYGCYKTAACVKTKDPSGKMDICKWQDTAELRSCLTSKGGNIGLIHAGLQ